MKRDRSVRVSLFAFALTRAVVFAIFVATTHVTLEGASPSVLGGAAQIIRVTIFPGSVKDKLSPLALRGDGGWYVGVAKKGYERVPFNEDKVHNWAFFPLYPLALRFASAFTGGFEITGMILSSFFFLAALVLLHKTAVLFGYDEATADRAIFYIAAFPTSYFFSLPLSESLFLLTTVGCVWAAKRDAWWLAGVFGALAAATRYNGLFLLPVLAVMYWEQHLRERPFKLRANILGLSLLPVGLLCFMLYLFYITGNAFAFIGIQKAWGVRSGFFLHPLYAYFVYPYDVSHLWNFRLLNFVAAITAFACGFALLKRREWALALYTFISVVVPLSTVTLESMTRYTMVVFPVFIMLGVAGRRPLIDQTIRTVSLVLLAILSVSFALYLSIALI